MRSVLVCCVVCCRVSALSLMAQAVHRLDKEAAASMLDVCTQVNAVVNIGTDFTRCHTQLSLMAVPTTAVLLHDMPWHDLPLHVYLSRYSLVVHLRVRPQPVSHCAFHAIMRFMCADCCC